MGKQVHMAIKETLRELSRLVAEEGGGNVVTVTLPYLAFRAFVETFPLCQQMTEAGFSKAYSCNVVELYTEHGKVSVKSK